MQIPVIIRILGLLLVLFSSTMLPPVFVGWLYDEGVATPFVDSFLLLLLTGLLLFLPFRNARAELRRRDGFLVVLLFWFVLGSAGGLPMYLSEALSLSLTDAVFESISGLTTTGATVVTGLDALPKSILFYRQELQWLGGMGIIVLAVAVLPMLGIGGMQLYRAETPGPVKDSKLTPRITGTAKALWLIYLGLTVACGLAYWLAGMTPFDAIAHAFSTVSTGGNSTHDASLGYFDSTTIELIAILFMFLSAVNFGLHFAALNQRRFSAYLRDAEFRTFFSVMIGVSLIIGGYLYATDTFHTLRQGFVEGLFHVVSIGTSTGFTTQAFYSWPSFVPVLLIYVSFMGGCSGSTGGGMKVIRVLLLFKQGSRELKRLVHPSGQFLVKVGRKPVSDKIIEAVWGFFAAYFGLTILMVLMLMASGLDQDTAFSAVAATLNNMGPGLGQVALNYAGISDFAKWVLVMAMLLGRLEIFTLLVLFTPGFWRK